MSVACSFTQSATAELSVWEQYKHQKHDLFVSEQEQNKAELYLTYGPGHGPGGASRMLKDEAGAAEESKQ